MDVLGNTWTPTWGVVSNVMHEPRFFRLWRLPLHRLALTTVLAFVATVPLARSQEAVFSGPQPGEKTTPFKCIEVLGDAAGKDRDLITMHKGASTQIIFVHGLERSMVPLMTVLDEYGALRKDKLRTEFVFLSRDPVESRQKLPLVAQSLKLKSPISLSTDGIEGPGNYGLNKECLLTVIVAKENTVAASYALVQPGIADAPKILRAIAKVIGDDHPPTADALREARGAGYGRMAKDGKMKREGDAKRPAANLPGAAPTDEKLVGLLRRFIQKSNDDATVDAVLKDVEAYIAGNADLKQQAIGGWTRVLHLKYGTEYAQKAGQSWLEKLKQ